jgi:transcription elongation GreA/GreB family factor
MKKITETAYKAIKKKIKQLEDQYADNQMDIGFHGNDQDGWHGEAYQLAMIEYYGLAEKLAKTKEQIAEVEVAVPKVKYTEVEVGARVIIKMDDIEREYLFDGIVYEKNVLTAESPIGKAIKGRKVGETVTFNAPSGQKELTIKDILTF